jgi:hypothetical protein
MIPSRELISFGTVLTNVKNSGSCQELSAKRLDILVDICGKTWI